jgi:hypothetical protein
MAGKPARLRVSTIAYGHAPDRRGERRDAYGRQPIAVRKRLFGGYKVIDGNDRLNYAARRGDSHINTVVFD